GTGPPPQIARIETEGGNDNRSVGGLVAREYGRPQLPELRLELLEGRDLLGSPDVASERRLGDHGPDRLCSEQRAAHDVSPLSIASHRWSTFQLFKVLNISSERRSSANGKI